MNKKQCNKCKRIISHANFSRHVCVSEEDCKAILEIYNQGMSSRDITTIKGYKSKAVHIALKNKKRSLHESLVLAHKLHADKFKHSQVTKDKIRQSILKARQNGIAYSWTRKKPSYAEKKFYNFLIELGLKENIDFVTEFPFSIYRVDFYFPKYKFVIEIDGKQHTKYIKIQQRDEVKDKYLKQQGIKVLRIIWRDLFHNTEVVYNDIKNILSNMQSCDIQIDTFTKAQARRLQMLREYEEKRKQLKFKKLQEKELKRQKLYDVYAADVKLIKQFKWGTIARLSELWNVSHTQVRKILKKLGYKR